MPLSGDVIEALTYSTDQSTYWGVLKNRLKKEGNETVTIYNAFPNLSTLFLH